MKISFKLAGIAIIAALFIGSGTTAASAQDADPGSGPKMQLNCHQKANEPLCDEYQYVTVNDMGYKPGSDRRVFRYHVEAIVPVGKVTAKVLSTGVTATRKIGSRTSNQSWLPVRVPDEGCPLVHLYHRGTHPRNFGVYPTCGVQVHFPKKHAEYFSLCKTNRSDHVKWMQLFRHRNLRERRRIEPGITACVESDGFSRHWRQRLVVTVTKVKTLKVDIHNTVLSGPIWDS
jgi:hypothetical protein